jgi:hypothetical protein
MATLRTDYEPDVIEWDEPTLRPEERPTIPVMAIGEYVELTHEEELAIAAAR